MTRSQKLNTLHSGASLTLMIYALGVLKETHIIVTPASVYISQDYVSRINDALAVTNLLFAKMDEIFRVRGYPPKPLFEVNGDKRSLKIVAYFCQKQYIQALEDLVLFYIWRHFSGRETRVELNIGIEGRSLFGLIFVCLSVSILPSSVPLQKIVIIICFVASSNYTQI